MNARLRKQIEAALSNLPKGFTFDAEPHVYSVGDRRIVNVTDVTGLFPKYALTPWAECVGIKETFERAHMIPAMETWEQMKAQITEDGCRASDYRDDKKEIGTIVHKAAEKLARTGKAPRLARFDEDIRPYVQALAAFWIGEKVRPIATEARVYSAQHEYAGTADLLYECDGGYGIRDYKSSNGIFDEAHVQVEAYVAALVEMGAPAPVEKQIVWLKDDGEYELVDVFAQLDEFLGFLAARRSLDTRAERKKARTAQRRTEAKAAKEAAKRAAASQKAKVAA